MCTRLDIQLFLQVGFKTPSLSTLPPTCVLVFAGMFTFGVLWAERVESSQSEDICSLCQLLKPELGKKEYEQASVETRLTRVLG